MPKSCTESTDFCSTICIKFLTYYFWNSSISMFRKYIIHSSYSCCFSKRWYIPPVSPHVTYVVWYTCIHWRMYILCIYKNMLEYKKVQCVLKLSLAKMRAVLGRVDIWARTLTSYWIIDVDLKIPHSINPRNRITWCIFWTSHRA